MHFAISETLLPNDAAAPEARKYLAQRASTGYRIKARAEPRSGGTTKHIDGIILSRAMNQPMKKQTLSARILDYVRLAAPEPEILRTIGVDSKSKGTNKLSSFLTVMAPHLNG